MKKLLMCLVFSLSVVFSLGQKNFEDPVWFALEESNTFVETKMTIEGFTLSKSNVEETSILRLEKGKEVISLELKGERVSYLEWINPPFNIGKWIYDFCEDGSFIGPFNISYSFVIKGKNLYLMR